MNTVVAPQTPFLRAAPELQRLPPLLRNDRVRLVKDVLRVGKWYVGDDVNGKPQYAVFSDSDLAAIAQRFDEHKAAGIYHPLCWRHTDPGKDDVDADQCIANVEHCWTESGTLWFAVYVTEEQANELTGQHRQTSIGLLRNWRDGTGKVWPGWSMMHAGIVAHAVVPDQHPFIQMAADTSPKGKRMTFDVVKSVINMLLAAVKDGTSLPESVSEENFDEMVPALVEVVLGKEPDTTEETTETVEGAPVVNAPDDLQMSAAMKPIAGLLKELIAEVRGNKARDAETAFRTKARELAEAGVPAGAIDRCLQMGVKNGWNTDVLELAAASNGTPLNMGSQTKLHRKSVPATPNKLTPEQIAEAKKFMGI